MKCIILIILLAGCSETEPAIDDHSTIVKKAEDCFNNGGRPVFIVDKETKVACHEY